MSATTTPSRPTRGSARGSPDGPRIMETPGGAARKTRSASGSPAETSRMVASSSQHDATTLNTFPSKAWAAERMRMASVRS
jgi:hypothetical protein